MECVCIKPVMLEFCFKGGGCGVGLGLGWGFGTAFGSQYRSSAIMFQGMEFDKKDQNDGASFKDLSKSTQEVRASQ
jgi:hypothetical protein